MTKRKDIDWAPREEWFKNLIKTFPEWEPPVRGWGATDHPVLTRLCTYPEMGLVWQILYEWWANAKHNSSIPHTENLFSGRCVRVVTEIALQCTAPELGLGTLTILKRQKLLEKTVRQAKALSKSLRELVAPESISHYIDWETRFEEVRERQLTFLYENSPEEEELIEVLHRMDQKISDSDEPDDYDSWNDLLEPISEEQIEQQATLLCDRLPHLSKERAIEGIRILNEPIPEPRTDWDEELMSKWQETREQLIWHEIRRNPSRVSIYDILNRIMSFENLDFPEPVVERAKRGNTSRLLAIRLYAKFLKHALERNPKSKEEREVIAMLVRTVLDDPDIGEDTVKNALKQYEV